MIDWKVRKKKMSDSIQTNAALRKFDGKPSFRAAFPQAMQHVLAMLIGNITPPMLIAGTCGLTVEEKIMLTQAAMIIGGITTLLQLFPVFGFGMRLPNVMGVAFAYMPILTVIGQQYGIAAIFGSQLIAGFASIFIGMFIGKIRRFFPPIVSGTVVMSIGLSAAAGVLVGKAIGSEQMDLAKQYARRMILLSVFVTSAASFAMFLLRHTIVGAMSLGPEARGYLDYMLLILVFYSLAQAVNTPIIVGVLRGGGDTRFGLILEAAALWMGSILMGAVGAFVWKLPVKAVFTLLMLDEFIKCPFALWRYKSRVWLKNLTR